MKKFEKSYVLYANESYFDIVSTCAKSIREFSKLPIFIYLLNSDKKVDVTNCITLNWSCDLNHSDDMYLKISENDNFYINRDDYEIYKLLIQRPRVIRDCLLKYSETVAYIDSDSVATPEIDRIFTYYPNNSKYPYLTEGVYDWLHKDGRGGAMDLNDLSTTLEHPLCDLLRINQYVRKKYRTTNVLISGQNTTDFLEEWYWTCINPKVLKNFTFYAPFHEETVANVLLWKYDFHESLPYVYMNGNDETIKEVFEEIEFDGHPKHIREWLRIPSSQNELLVVHGEKRIPVMERMIGLLKNYYNKKGLYYKDIKIADAGFIINLPHRTDRKESVTNLLDDLGISGYEFVDGIIFENETYKKLGCTATYIEIYKKCLSENYKDVIIFEDDITLMNNVTKNDLDNIFSDWKEITRYYDVVSLGVKMQPRTKIIRTGNNHGYFEEMLCSQSLYYKRNFIEHFISEMENYLSPNHPLYMCTIDMFLNDCSSEKYRFIHYDGNKKFNFGTTIPMLFNQSSSFSDNENMIQSYSQEIENNFLNSLLFDEAYVLYGTEKYVPLIKETIKSIRQFSKLPIVVYLLNCSEKLMGNNVYTIRWNCDIRNQNEELYYNNRDGENYYIDRNRVAIYDILVQRPLIVKHALHNFAKTICYIDSDSVVLPNIDNIFNLYPKDKSFPYFTTGIYDYMIWEEVGGSNGDDLSTTLEHPVCSLYNIDQSFRKQTVYRQTGYFLAGQNTIDFLNEWYEMCDNPIIRNSTKHYAAYHEETIVNCLLWKKEIKEGLPSVYINGTFGTIDTIYNKITYTGSKQFIKEWVAVPGSFDELFFIHGEKRIPIIEDMIREIVRQDKLKNKNDNLKILFLAPHLSTGGMPSFLLKRIESLLEYYPRLEIFVVEYSDFSPEYVVQKNKIRSILPKSNFYTLGADKSELINIIKNNNIDIVHVDEVLEGFDSYNQVSDVLLNELYHPNRTWRIIETCHNVWFDPNTSKKFNPDGYVFCTPYHKEISFSQMISPSVTLQFPLEEFEKDSTSKTNARNKLSFNKDKIHILNVGLWTPGKNQGEGIEIARMLEKTNPELHFHFVGNQAPNFQSYWEPIMRNIPSNVTVWGERNDVSTFMMASDVMMFNSTWECNPLVIREAISHKLKIMARNLPQYLGMFDGFIEEIDDNISLTSHRLLNLIKTDVNYSIPKNQLHEFSSGHLEFYKKIITNSPLKNNKITSKVIIDQNFVGQPFLEIKGVSDSNFDVVFMDENDKVQYQNKIKSNHWIKLNRTYYTKWKTQVYENGDLIYENTLNYKNKRVYIAIDSSSLGDTVAWIPYCLEFKKKHECEVIVSCFWNKLFEKTYPELKFVKPSDIVNNIHGMYKLGWFFDEKMEPQLPHIIPLQKTATNILGLDYEEIKPTVNFNPSKRPIKGKYITIATNSTAGCKFWTKEGWQNLVNYLHSIGYKIINVSKENNPFKNVERLKDTSIENTMNVIHHSEFFIGLSSGLSWLAWALGKHVVMISNFTEPDHEFTSNCTRIIKKDVCNGCWNNPDFRFDKGDWNWCPIHKGTQRQFECHTSITHEMVIEQIKHLLNI